MQRIAQTWVVLFGVVSVSTTAVAAGKSAPAGGHMTAQQLYEQLYIERVLDQINVAREIRAGRGTQLAARIERALPRYLKAMKGFKDSPDKNVAYHNAAEHLKSNKIELAPDVKALVDQYAPKVSVVRGQDCYALSDTCGDPDSCVPVPTSLQPINPSQSDPNGWQCSNSSTHCGAGKSFPYSPCGECLGLIACTGGGSNNSGGNSSGGNSSGGNSSSGNSSSGNSSSGNTQSGGQGSSNQKAR